MYCWCIKQYFIRNRKLSYKILFIMYIFIEQPHKKKADFWKRRLSHIYELAAIFDDHYLDRDFMKSIFLISTIFLQFLSVVALKLLDNFWLIIGIFILSIAIGGLLKFSKTINNVTVLNIGWGLFYGSLTSLGLVIIFMIWLSFNFPK